MRGTRVDTHDSHPSEVVEGRYHIIHFGVFSTGEESKTMNMSEKDFMNLYGQMTDILKRKRIGQMVDLLAKEGKDARKKTKNSK